MVERKPTGFLRESKAAYILAGLAAFALCAAFFVSIDAVDVIYHYSRAHEDWELDELIAAVPAVAVGLLVYTYFLSRRLREEIHRKTVSESKLAAVTKRLQAIVHTVPAVVYICRPSGDYGVTFISENVSKLMGGGPLDYLGRPMFRADNIHPEDAPGVLSGMKEAIEVGESVHDFRYRDGVGRRRWLHNTLRLVRDPSGRPLEIIGCIIDITELKAHESRLASLLKELQRSNAELQQFAYVASHDLQEPLRIIAGFSQLLSRRYKGKLDSDADDFIGYVVDGVKRMQDLIEDLLAYSRVHTKGGALEPENLSLVVQRAEENLQLLIEETKTSIHVGELPTLPVDGRQLVQLFQNLLHNAIKFRGEETPVIHISARPEGGHWEVEVRDNGIGIDPEYSERIFEVFKRLHSSSEYPGTGIGLAICKRIVERHKGRIWVEPSPDGGTAFRFTLPAEVEAGAGLGREEA